MVLLAGISAAALVQALAVSVVGGGVSGADVCTGLVLLGRHYCAGLAVGVGIGAGAGVRWCWHQVECLPAPN